MFRAIALLLGGICMPILVGCSLDSFSLSVSSKPHMDQLFNGPLAVVSILMQQTLTDYHIKFTSSTSDTDTVKLIGTTVPGDQFTLILKKAKTERGEKTQARMEWEKQGDEQFWTALVQATIKNINKLGIQQGDDGTGPNAFSPNAVPFNSSGMMPQGGMSGMGMGQNGMREAPGPITPEERQQIFGIR